MIAIPNMSKPKRCVDCVCNNDDYMCNATHMEIDWQSQQVNDDCPLIEIVTCGECKHWNEETHGCNRNTSVGAWWETDFCSYGERRTDDLDRVPNDEG